MKKLLSIVFISFFLAIASPAISGPADPASPVTNTAKERAEVLLHRLYEIKDMPKENLSREEKKDLRKEVKNIRKELRGNSKGIYLSIGAIIVIILLLILLLK